MTQDVPTGPGQLRGALEAVLLVVDEPVPEVELAVALECPREQVMAALIELAAEYTAAGRGFELRRVAAGWRLYTRAEYAAYVERFVRSGAQGRLSAAALETLAVIAYRQPVTRSRIAAVRGVTVDGVLRTLRSRGLIIAEGTQDSGAVTYRTTDLLLERLGISSLAELPEIAPMLPDVLATDEESDA